MAPEARKIIPAVPPALEPVILSSEPGPIEIDLNMN